MCRIYRQTVLLPIISRRWKRMKFSFSVVICREDITGEPHLSQIKGSGPKWGIGRGLTGKTYAIPTMRASVEMIKPYVDEFISFARTHTEYRFLVTRIGCGIAGFTDRDIAPLFCDAVDVPNIALPLSFWHVNIFSWLMSVLYLFNPENDLALANGGKKLYAAAVGTNDSPGFIYFAAMVCQTP